jgi:hypothetical protein
VSFSIPEGESVEVTSLLCDLGRIYYSRVTLEAIENKRPAIVEAIRHFQLMEDACVAQLDDATGLTQKLREAELNREAGN